jgi:hypothetical protein
MSKPMNPYTALMESIRSFIFQLKRQQEQLILMWTYPKKDLDGHWNLKDLYERVSAARQLKHEVLIKATDEGLEVWYRAPLPPIPCDWRI